MSRNLEYVSAEELSEWVRDGKTGVKIVDVRDEDFVDGHIPGALNHPSESFVAEEFADTLAAELADHEVVVFHCMKSQQRGPSCATRYLAALSRLENPTEQQVLVLQGGFERWSSLYGTDDGLVTLENS